MQVRPVVFCSEGYKLISSSMHDDARLHLRRRCPFYVDSSMVEDSLPALRCLYPEDPGTMVRGRAAFAS